MPNTIPNDARELKLDELDGVSGGIKGALEGVCKREGGQNDAAQMFQQILQQLTQGAN